MVVICAPDAALTGKEQDLVATPSTWTVQAPHWAMPQPYFVPVIPIHSLMTHSNGVSGSTSTSYGFPLIVRLTIPFLLGRGVLLKSAYDDRALFTRSGENGTRRMRDAGCVEDRVRDRRGDRSDRGFAPVARSNIGAVDENDVDRLGRLGDVKDRISDPV